MAFIHGYAARGTSGLEGLQSEQRDWSPFVVHFTTWSHMAEVRQIYRKESGTTAKDVRKELEAADAGSFGTATAILQSGQILARQLNSPNDGSALPIPPCVCLSECALPGLLGHAERYGRFGFVFKKSDIWQLGGRPCLYVDADFYALSQGLLRSTHPERFGLMNKVVPAGPSGEKPQDFTHEREWRVFRDISLKATPPTCVIVPSIRYIASVSALLSTNGLKTDFLLPMDTMFSWGV